MDDETLTLRLCEIVGGIPSFAWWLDDTPYPKTSIGVHYGSIDEQTDRAVGIRVYSASDEPGLNSRRAQLHVRGGRGDPFGADRIGSVLFVVLHERLRGDGIASIRRTSFVPLGADTNGREERTENYLITLDNLEASS